MLSFAQPPSGALFPIFSLDYPTLSSIEWSMNTKIYTVQTRDIDDGREYIINGDYRFPSVNTVLQKTMPPKRKQQLAAWAINQRNKWIRSQRKCANCLWYGVNNYCDKLQNPRPPQKKNRCQEFDIKPELDTYDPRSKALQSGTDVHHWIEKFFQTGDFPPPEECQKIQQIKYFLHTLYEDWIAIEEPVCSFNHNYAGRLDFIGRRGEEIWLIDWTTTRKSYVRQEWYEDKFIQAAAYAIAIEEMRVIKSPVEKLAVVVMGKEKGFLFEAEPEEYKGKWLQRLGEYYGEH